MRMVRPNQFLIQWLTLKLANRKMSKTLDVVWDFFLDTETWTFALPRRDYDW